MIIQSIMKSEMATPRLYSVVLLHLVDARPEIVKVQVAYERKCEEETNSPDYYEYVEYVERDIDSLAETSSENSLIEQHAAKLDEGQCPKLQQCFCKINLITVRVKFLGKEYSYIRHTFLVIVC